MKGKSLIDACVCVRVCVCVCVARTGATTDAQSEDESVISSLKTHVLKESEHLTCDMSRWNFKHHDFVFVQMHKKHKRLKR